MAGAFIEAEETAQGFYTQQDLEDIVEHARKRHVMVIPEIEVPGHAYSAVKSYPWLCCTGRPERNPGHQKDLYCAGRETTFEFLEDVLTEVMDVFPAPFVHIGGDEAPKDRWRKCPDCQGRIAHEGLAGEEGLQGYMIRRVAELLQRGGRRAIGWEEILDGGVDSTAVVHWWRYRTCGTAAVEKALRRGHQVIASPNSLCYLSFPVTPDEHFKPERTSDLSQVYAARYVPEELSSEARNQILGAQCCCWTEYLTEHDIDKLLFPRILACAELMWRYPSVRDFPTFAGRVQAEEPGWRALGVEYGPAFAEVNR